MIYVLATPIAMAIQTSQGYKDGWAYCGRVSSLTVNARARAVNVSSRAVNVGSRAVNVGSRAVNVSLRAVDVSCN